MASNDDTLSSADISQVTDIVSAKNRFRFCVEYLGIDRNEYHTIEDEAKSIHHDTLYECITRWKIRTGAQGKHPKDELIKILNQIRREHGWFPFNAMAFLTDVTGRRIHESRLNKIQDWTKESLKRRLKKSLSNDWMPQQSAHKFPLREYYVQLEWKQKIRRAMRSETITLTSLHDLIKQIGIGTRNDKTQESKACSKNKNPPSVIIEGEGGIGKTSSLGMLALDWAEDIQSDLQQFQFVFLILLRHVEGNESLEEIIMKQHGRLETENVSPSEVKAILQGETDSNILLMFDGYDEYSEGTNEDIDKILLNGKDNCMIIVSSRSGDFLHQIKSSIDEEVRITGFSQENIIKCAEQYLGSQQLSQSFLTQAKQSGVHSRENPSYSEYDGLLHVPIILLMACAVFIENKCLPSSKTEIFDQVVHMCISRTTLKTMAKTASKVNNLHRLMVKLGKLAWEALNKHSKQLLLYKKDIIAESADILKLGLLFGEDIDATTIDLPEVLSFQHKLIQEYLAAVYIADTLKVKASAEVIEGALTTWEEIKNHREVIQFTCGILTKDGVLSHLINHVAMILNKYIEIGMNEGQGLSMGKELSLLSSFQREGAISSINPFITKYPACGKPLAEVLAQTKLVVITDIDENDTLQLNTSSANIILLINRTTSEFDRLCQALHSIKANGLALSMFRTNEIDLKHLFQMKHLFILDAKYHELNDLAVAINRWGPHPPVTYCELRKLFSSSPMPPSLLTALSRCTHLQHLDLSHRDLHDKLSTLMASPPPGLRKVILWLCNLHAGDIDHVAQAMREDKLTQLQHLDIWGNPIGEEALGSLLEVISIRPHALQLLILHDTGIDEAGRKSPLSEQFVNEWKNKLTNIYVEWYMDQSSNQTA